MYIFPVVLYGFKGVLLLLGVYLAVISRNAPALFNEAPTLALIICNIAITSILLLPISAFIESPTQVYAIEMIGMLWGILSTLFLLFFQKIQFVKMSIEDPNSVKFGAQRNSGRASKTTAAAINSSLNFGTKTPTSKIPVINTRNLYVFSSVAPSASGTMVSTMSSNTMNSFIDSPRERSEETQEAIRKKNQVLELYKKTLEENNELRRRFVANTSESNK